MIPKFPFLYPGTNPRSPFPFTTYLSILSFSASSQAFVFPTWFSASLLTVFSASSFPLPLSQAHWFTALPIQRADTRVAPFHSQVKSGVFLKAYEVLCAKQQGLFYFLECTTFSFLLSKYASQSLPLYCANSPLSLIPNKNTHPRLPFSPAAYLFMTCFNGLKLRLWRPSHMWPMFPRPTFPQKVHSSPLHSPWPPWSHRWLSPSEE